MKRALTEDDSVEHDNKRLKVFCEMSDLPTDVSINFLENYQIHYTFNTITGHDFDIQTYIII